MFHLGTYSSQLNSHRQLTKSGHMWLLANRAHSQQIRWISFDTAKTYTSKICTTNFQLTHNVFPVLFVYPCFHVFTFGYLKVIVFRSVLFRSLLARFSSLICLPVFFFTSFGYLKEVCYLFTRVFMFVFFTFGYSKVIVFCSVLFRSLLARLSGLICLPVFLLPLAT